MGSGPFSHNPPQIAGLSKGDSNVALEVDGRWRRCAIASFLDDKASEDDMSEYSESFELCDGKWAIISTTHMKIDSRQVLN